MAAAAARKPLQKPLERCHPTVHEGMRPARRAFKHLRENALDTYDGAIHRVKRHPSKALAIAAGAGACLGLGLGVLIGRAIFRDRRSFFGL